METILLNLLSAAGHGPGQVALFGVCGFLALRLLPVLLDPLARAAAGRIDGIGEKLKKAEARISVLDHDNAALQTRLRDYEGNKRTLEIAVHDLREEVYRLQLAVLECQRHLRAGQ